ncbi:MAG: J domain-containing protein [Geobacter sp.]|nr:J domain-containing protein [Geobacter sp.]
MNYEELNDSLEVLGLSSRASLKEIKERHRALVKEHHPDAGGMDVERIRRINDAYRIVTNYVANYCFSFSEEEFYRQNPEERLMRQFEGDPLWGGLGVNGKGR